MHLFCRVDFYSICCSFPSFYFPSCSFENGNGIFSESLFFGCWLATQHHNKIHGSTVNKGFCSLATFILSLLLLLVLVGSVVAQLPLCRLIRSSEYQNQTIIHINGKMYTHISLRRWQKIRRKSENSAFEVLTFWPCEMKFGAILSHESYQTTHTHSQKGNLRFEDRRPPFWQTKMPIKC